MSRLSAVRREDFILRRSQYVTLFQHMPNYQPLRHYDRFKLRTWQQPEMVKQCARVVPFCTVMWQTAQRKEYIFQLLSSSVTCPVTPVLVKYWLMLKI